MIRKKSLLLSVCLLAVAVAGLGVWQSRPVSAANALDWKAGRIIDDPVFTNKDAMSVAEIQAFLNQRVGTGGYDSVPGQCDTFGARKALPYSSSSRAAYANSIGKPARWTCLSNYYEVPKTEPGPGIPANNYGSDTIPPGAKSAAQLIWDAAQAYNISPKVLLVTIQKESAGPLTTDDWPWQSQYTYAMGAHCPDSGPNGSANCDPDYAGFSIQIRESAELLRWYLDNMSQPWWQYKKLGVNSIRYDVEVSCGSSDVNIETKATAALYTYTPYQPNQAALNNLYGTGDGCSAYGNRNFWRIYWDWFGNPRVTTPYAWVHQSNGAWSDSARTKPFTTNLTIAPGERAYLRVSVRNVGNRTWNKTNFRLGTLGPMDRASPFADTDWIAPQRPVALNETTVAPGDSGTFLFSIKAPSTPGTYTERYGLLVEGQEWLEDLGIRFTVNVTPLRTAYPHAQTTLRTGEYLHKGDYIMSPDTQTVMTLQGDGNLVIFQNFKPVWDSRTAGTAADELIVQVNGNLALLNHATNQIFWQTNTAGSGGNQLIAQTDGNVTFYNASMSAPWEAFTAHNKNLLGFANPSTGTTRLFPGQQLETTDRRYKLLFQPDGNLVLYSPNRALWSTNTAGKPIDNVSLLPDGNLILHDNNGTVYWQARTAGAGPSRLIMQDDGNLVLYSSSRATWNSETAGKN